MELPEISEVKVVKVDPGDVIVLRGSRRISKEQARALMEYAQPLWPDNQIAVLPGEVDISVVRAHDPVLEQEC